jgi:serine/threonine protein kinase
VSTPDKPPDGSDTIVERSRTRLGVGEVRRAPPTELVGQIVHGYLVEAELGSGAMGTVYRASHVETHRTVAIKALHPEHLHERQIVERFKREAQLAARLSHPNVAGVLEVGTAIEDGRHLIVMEYVDGEPLSARPRARGRARPPRPQARQHHRRVARRSRDRAHRRLRDRGAA